VPVLSSDGSMRMSSSSKSKLPSSEGTDEKASRMAVQIVDSRSWSKTGSSQPSADIVHFWILRPTMAHTSVAEPVIAPNVMADTRALVGIRPTGDDQSPGSRLEKERTA
jgi:hypothetical protein